MTQEHNHDHDPSEEELQHMVGKYIQQLQEQLRVAVTAERVTRAALALALEEGQEVVVPLEEGTQMVADDEGNIVSKVTLFKKDGKIEIRL